MGAQSVRINGNVKIPKVWFMPNGNNGWSVLVSDRGLNMIVDNYRNLEKCCFEAVVPLVSAPCGEEITSLLIHHFKERKNAWGLWSISAIGLGLLGTVAGIICSIFSPYFMLLGLGGAICFGSVLLECVFKYKKYNDMAFRLATANVDFETTYRPFLEVLKSEIDNPSHDALEDGIEAENISIEEIDHVARMMTQSYVNDHNFSPVALTVYSKLIKLSRKLKGNKNEEF